MQTNIIFLLICFETYPEVLRAYSSYITPDGVQGTTWSYRDKIQVSCIHAPCMLFYLSSPCILVFIDVISSYYKIRNKALISR